MKFRMRHADQIVGLFVLTAALAVISILILMGINQRWFAKNYHFRTQFMSAHGLNVGMPIRLKGFQIGSLHSISLFEDNTVLAEILIYDSYYDRVRNHSVIELVSSPIGLGSNLLFHPGKSEVLHEEYDFIPSLDFIEGKMLVANALVQMPPGSDMIGAILNQVEPLLANINDLAVSSTQLLDELYYVIDGKSQGPIASILHEVDSILVQAGAIADNSQQDLQTVLRNLNSILVNVDYITADTQGLVVDLIDPKGSLASFLDDDNKLFFEIQDLLSSVNAALDEILLVIEYVNHSTPQITGLLENTRDALDTGRDVMQGLTNNPLLRRGIPEKVDQQNFHQGYRNADF